LCAIVYFLTSIFLTNKEEKNSVLTIMNEKQALL